MPLITYRQALNDALAEELTRDENVIILGEEVAEYNGAYKVTEGLLGTLRSDKRVIDTPISEAAFIGLGLGASFLGLKPVVELMFWSFSYVAFDQLIQQRATVRYMSRRPDERVPIVIRGPGQRRDQRRRDPFTYAGKPCCANHPGPQGGLSGERPTMPRA
jgi:pyruvate dehydrogenase E1 component beta subunit